MVHVKIEQAHQVVDNALLITKILEISDPQKLDLGTLCRIHRAKRKQTIEDAAKSIGISRHLLSSIEDGKIPQRSKLELVCKYYGEGFRTGIKLLQIGSI